MIGADALFGPEVFLTASNYRYDRPGPVSTRLKEIYWRMHDEGWHHTPVRYQMAEASA